MRNSPSRPPSPPRSPSRGLPADGSQAPHAEPAGTQDARRDRATANPANRPRGHRPDQLLAMSEVAALLGVSKRTLWSWIAAGRLPVVRLGRRVTRVESGALARLVAEARVEGGR